MDSQNRLNSGIDTNNDQRSMEVREFMSRMPSWTLRWGISLIFLILILAFTGSAFIDYPDTLEGELVLTSDRPTQWITAKNSGRLSDLWVSNQKKVKEGEWLGVLENPASTSDVSRLLSELDKLELLEPKDSMFVKFNWPELILGEIQPSYNHFVQLYSDYTNFLYQPYYELKLTSLHNKKKMLDLYYERIWEQRMALQEQLKLAHDKLMADSILFQEKVIASLTYKQRQSQYLQKRHAFHGARSQLAQMKVQVEDLNQTIVELEQERNDKQSAMLQQLAGAKDELWSQINRWEQRYLLKAETNGKIDFQYDLSGGAIIPAGIPLMTIAPMGQPKVFAIATIPAHGASKIKSGQLVHVYLDEYIYQESGQLIGKVLSASKTPIPSEGGQRVYRVKIDIPEDWTSTFGKSLELKQQMVGKVEIITDDISLLERLFNQIRKLTHSQA